MAAINPAIEIAHTIMKSNFLLKKVFLAIAIYDIYSLILPLYEFIGKTKNALAGVAHVSRGEDLRPGQFYARLRRTKLPVEAIIWLQPPNLRFITVNLLAEKIAVSRT